jgi:DNA ligase-1
MLLRDLVTASAAVARAGGRRAKVDHLAAVLERLPPDAIAIAVGFLSGEPRQGRLGLGPAAISAARSAAPAPTSTLSLTDVDRAFARLSAIRGTGATGQRVGLLRDLLSRATADEQDFLVRLLFGELRQGAVEGVLLEAVARAGRLDPDALRRAAMMAGDLGPVAAAALTAGAEGLAPFGIRVLQPVQPMLAQPAGSLDEALDSLDEDVGLEWKIDGARIQVHKAGDEVRVFSRNLRDVTVAVPDIVETMRRLPVDEAVLDGEVIALKEDGRPHPFQVTMQRFGRRLDVDALRARLPLTPFLFDAMLLDGAALIDRPQQERFDALRAMAPGLVVPHALRPDRGEAARFVETALARGHEGVMAKARRAPYAAGRRGQSWLKIKAARTLDLVILAAEWGHGRRQGWLSNLHLGAPDPSTGAFVMLGKTFKGLTDEMLAWQTRALLALELSRDASTVYVRPELVVEIAFNDVQESPQYPAGLALRFARVKGYRRDKTAAGADTIARVRDIYRDATGLEPPSRPAPP